MLGAPVFRTALFGPWSGNALWTAARAVPSLDLCFADKKDLICASSGRQLISFARASSGTYVDSAGVLQTAATDVPRFDHNPLTGESLGLLVEEQRTNLLLRSEEINDAAWTTLALNATVSANQTTAPNGATTADSIADDAVNNVHYIGQSVAVAAATTYTFSCFLRAGTSNFGYLSLSGGGPGWGDTFVVNLSTGVGNVQAGSFGSTSIQAFADGWYRVVVTKITTGSGSPQLRIGVAQSLSVTSYSGSGNTIFAWGAQLEAGAFASSYIPTTTAAATRNADVASITGTNFSSWYRQDEGTVYAEAASYLGAAAVSRGVVSIDGAAGDVHRIFRQSDLQPVAGTQVSNVAQATFGFGATWSTAAVQKIAYTYAVNNFAGSANGGTVQTDTVGTVPTTSTLNIGNISGGNQFGGHIRRLTYWPQALPGRLQAITQP